MSPVPSAPAAQCVVCGLPLSGVLGAVFGLIGIGRSPRNPNCCSRCNTHIQEGRLVEMTMIFADLSSFTEMTNRLGADPTFDIVDAYLRVASRALTAHGAFIDKYIGDAVMAFFNVPIARPDHAAAAVAAARSLCAELPELSKRLGVPLQVSIGIATGYARVGRLGSDDIKDYTAIGPVVNEAARLQSNARAGEILVSEAVYEKVAADHPGVPVERLTVKGFREPVAARRLQSAGAPPPPAPPMGSAALDWSALAMAVLGAGCLGTSLVGPLLISLGAAGGALALSFARWMDLSPLRFPLLLAASALAAASLAGLWREHRLRLGFKDNRACIVPTPREKRRNLLIVGTSALTLVCVGLEVVVHWFSHHRVF